MSSGTTYNFITRRRSSELTLEDIAIHEFGFLWSGSELLIEGFHCCWVERLFANRGSRLFRWYVGYEKNVDFQAIDGLTGRPSNAHTCYGTVVGKSTRERSLGWREMSRRDICHITLSPILLQAGI